MDLDQLKQILDLVRQHELSEFEIEHEGLRLKIRKDAGRTALSVPAGQGASTSVGGAAPSTPAGPMLSSPSSAPDFPAETAEDTVELAVVKSPIVGTFYRSSEPAAPPFVEIGSVVKKGQVLCIIEAMKLMNEIDSEYEGEVVNVYVETGHPVQYGERLFAIRTNRSV
jgi:acetyl-CoA carboxylase biotin carboxyl carrier protein